MKKICIIYTGGTIGMVPTDHGYAPKAGYFEKELRSIPELSMEGMPEWDFIEFDPLLDSSNITVEQWNQIGHCVADHYGDYDGFVVLHGTDTMAYTASALSFMFEGLEKPVVLTGSQIPLCRLRSDARDNIITSMLIAAAGQAKEVCLYFGGRLLRGNRSTKSSADGLLAFDSPNYPPLATVGIDINYRRSALSRPWRKNPMSSAQATDTAQLTASPQLAHGSHGATTLKSTEFHNASIGVIKIFPGIQFSLFEPIMTEGLNGIVLETFGTGNIPSYGDDLPPMIERAFASGTIVTVCSQCPQGTVRLGAYETSSRLTRAGAVSGSNMTTEAAVAKLYYLFSQDLSRDEIKAKMEENLRGEMNVL